MCRASRQGETVEVTVEAVPGLVVNGVVERISPQATIKNNIKGYPARILLRNVDPRVRPGMTANVKIPVASAANVTAVPLAAVFTEKASEEGDYERFVYVQKGDAFEKRNVKVGVSDYFYAEIQDGLNEGDVVSLELPKDEREQKAKQLAGQKKKAAGAPGGKAAAKPRTAPVEPSTTAPRPPPPHPQMPPRKQFRQGGTALPEAIRFRSARRALTSFPFTHHVFTHHASHGPRRTPQRQQNLPPR